MGGLLPSGGYATHLSTRGKCPRAAGNGFPFDPKRLCARKGGKPLRIVAVGDSLSEQLARSLVNTLVRRLEKSAAWAVAESVPQSCKDWAQQQGKGGGSGSESRAPTTFCTTYLLHDSLCANLSITFIRNDHLQVRRARGNNRARKLWTVAVLWSQVQGCITVQHLTTEM